ncbi:hypothetical protein ACJ8BN_01290, partial [Klebsiella pneumoniae]
SFAFIVRRFVTKTLVNKDGDIQRRIMAMFSN